jgi:GH18 family chitinase
LQELREEFDKFGWLLTAPLGVIPDTIEHSYDIPAISKYLDYMFALCYAYHGHWETQAGPDAPLYPLYQDDEYNVVRIRLQTGLQTRFSYGPQSLYRNLQQTVICML